MLLVNEATSLTDFWESAHRSDTHLWISGTPPKEIYDRLNVSKFLTENKLSILNVGVGEGYCEVDLTNKGHSVDSLDISQSALIRVQKYVREGFLSADDLPSNRYDLIIHHLVAQHMSCKDLEVQVAQLVRSLSPTGVIAMQFASSQSDHTLTTSNQSESVLMPGGVLRSKTSIQEIAHRSLGMVQAFFDNENWSHSDCRFLTAHIVRNENFRCALTTEEVK
jgi:2-polyprenyl-3-methyl-5-hydroxy-6-metoxy-1,4-benzoquinol methylase